MFTGIVEELGTVRQIRKGRASAVLTIGAGKVLEDAKIGDSIAVNGICLTVTGLENGAFTADVMHETLNRTAFSRLSAGSRVNLERAMAADGRFGGHIVAGHVDGTGTITNIRKDDNAIWYTILAGPDLLRYIVEKGSITVEGISLTVAEVGADHFSVSAIPHTVAHTVLQDRKKGDPVNLETDIIGKYVEKLLFSGGEEWPETGEGGRGPAAGARGKGSSFVRRRETGEPGKTGGAGKPGKTGLPGETGKPGSGISRAFLLENGFYTR